MSARRPPRVGDLQSPPASRRTATRIRAAQAPDGGCKPPGSCPERGCPRPPVARHSKVENLRHDEAPRLVIGMSSYLPVQPRPIRAHSRDSRALSSAPDPSRQPLSPIPHSPSPATA